MNILPKKRWHVRNKDNIARVRRDEAEAAEKEREEKKRVEQAEREARLSLLKHKNRLELANRQIQFEPPTHVETFTEDPSASTSSSHVNIFENFDKNIKTTNKDHDKEVTEKKEEYEKKIGYLTYLGQDTNEALKKKNWYEVLPKQRTTHNEKIKETHDKLVLKDRDGKPIAKELDEKNGEICWKAKQSLDPLNAFRKYCFSSKNINKPAQDVKNKDDSAYSQIISSQKTNTHKSKKRKHKREKEDRVEKEKKLQQLREARLKREKEERRRTEKFLRGEDNVVSDKGKEQPRLKVKAKYNSQFNPELARQNFT